MAKGPSIIDRLMGRGRKTNEEEDSTDDSAPPPEEGSGEDDGATGTGDDVEGTVDETQGTVDDTAPDDQTTESGDIVSDGSEENAQVVGDSAIQTGDGVTETSGDISDGTEAGDAIEDDTSDAVIDDGSSIEVSDGDAPLAYSDTPDIVTGAGAGGPGGHVRARFDPGEESELEQQVNEIQEVAEPQLDPALIEARFGDLGPKPPDPDDGGDNLGFGQGASPLDTDGLEPIETPQAELDTNALQPMPRFTVDDRTVDGIDTDDVSPAGSEPAGVGPVESDPTQVQIDDPGPHGEPTEVDID